MNRHERRAKVKRDRLERIAKRAEVTREILRIGDRPEATMEEQFLALDQLFPPLVRPVTEHREVVDALRSMWAPDR